MPKQAVLLQSPHLKGATIPPSRLPWYALNDSDPKDLFFTKDEIAKYCWGVFKDVARSYNFNIRALTFIEPSAGNGCFMDLLPERRRIALDIAPRRRDVKRQDFLRWSPPADAKRRFACIGNPPFGVRGAIALAFINRAAIFADLAAFILPMTFESDGKGGALTRVDGFNLLHSEELPRDSFYMPNGGAKKVNTLWQVWGKGVKPKTRPIRTCNSYIEVFTACTAPDRRCGMRRMREADWFIQSTFYTPPKVVRDFSDVKYGSGYGIIIKRNKREINRILREADWRKYSSKATNSCRHIRMKHIRQVITDGGLYD
ncbi:MAG: hypothetical protein OXU65_04710 [Deltaproteobacteria bacterium]|nr:hypothetical protein [Deltaproteobacteria bacterium]